MTDSTPAVTEGRSRKRTMESNVQQAQRVGPTAKTEGLRQRQSPTHRHARNPQRGWKTPWGCSLRVALKRCGGCACAVWGRVGLGLPRGKDRELAKGAQENALQHPCACSARSTPPHS